jgi:excisionase family DNA binding protein
MALPDRDDVLEAERPALPPRLLSEGAAANYLGVSRRTVTRLLNNGELSLVQIPACGGRGDVSRRTLIDKWEIGRVHHAMAREAPSADVARERCS